MKDQYDVNRPEYLLRRKPWREGPQGVEERMRIREEQRGIELLNRLRDIQQSMESPEPLLRGLR